MNVFRLFGLSPTSPRYSRKMVCDALERRGCERAPWQDPDIAQEYWLTPGGKEFQVPKRPSEFPDWMTHDILTDVARLGGLNPFAHSGRD